MLAIFLDQSIEVVKEKWNQTLASTYAIMGTHKKSIEISTEYVGRL